MKKLLLALLLSITSLSLIMSPAEAKRLGGGGSFGKQSSNYSRQAAPSSPSYSQPSATPYRPSTPAATSPSSRTPVPAPPTKPTSRPWP